MEGTWYLLFRIAYHSDFETNLCSEDLGTYPFLPGIVQQTNKPIRPQRTIQGCHFAFLELNCLDLLLFIRVPLEHQKIDLYIGRETKFGLNFGHS